MTAIKLFRPDSLGAPEMLPSIFLAGPTPRSTEVQSWRPAAIEELESLSFDCTVFVPERANWVGVDYYEQIKWELRALEYASVVAFWVPRDMATMPALTTNVEFGMLIKSGRILYGRPDSAVHMRYLDHLYTKYTGRTPFTSLKVLMTYAADLADLNYEASRRLW